STDPHVRFYLPEYRLNVIDGRYTTRLKWRDANDDPNGPLAFLTVEVVAIVPPSSGFTLQEIPHQAVASIAYQMPIQGADQSSGGQPASEVSGARAVMRFEVGALNPIEGVRRGRLAISDKRDFDRLFQVMTDSNLNSSLEIRCFARA